MRTSALLKKSTEILFSKHPRAAGWGILFGLLIYRIIQVTGDILTPVRFSILWVLLQLPLLIYVVLALLIFTLIANLRQSKLHPSISTAMDTIEEGKKKGDFTDDQVRMMYYALVYKVINQVDLTDDTQDEIDQRTTE